MICSNGGALLTCAPCQHQSSLCQNPSSPKDTGFTPVKSGITETAMVCLCGCKHTGDQLFCDGMTRSNGFISLIAEAISRKIQIRPSRSRLNNVILVPVDFQTHPVFHNTLYPVCNTPTLIPGNTDLSPCTGNQGCMNFCGKKRPCARMCTLEHIRGAACLSQPP